MVALEPTLLLLDEPSSGIAQRETEALGELLNELKKALGVTLVVIEHDIPLIMGLADAWWRWTQGGSSPRARRSRCAATSRSSTPIWVEA